jgi:hypothetical protein
MRGLHLCVHRAHLQNCNYLAVSAPGIDALSREENRKIPRAANRSYLSVPASKTA